MRTHSCLLTLSFALFSTAASAQSPLACTINSVAVPSVRVEGVAEEIKQMVITCTGGTPTTAGSTIPSVSIDITLNTNVTSRLLDQSGTRSEALLLIDEPQPSEQVEASTVPFSGSVLGLGNGQYKGAGRPNVFGAQQATPKSLHWQNIPFDPPGNGGSRVLRLVNIRANANSLGAGGIFSPSVVTMSVAGSAPLDAAIPATPQTAAQVLTGVALSTTPATLQQCTPGNYSFPIVFSESFGGAFRQASALSGQNVPGAVYNTESMFFNDAFTAVGAGAGKAAHGTYLRVRFSSIPANVTITVPTSSTNASGDMAALVATGTEGSTANGSTGLVSLSSGAGVAVWEVKSSNADANTISALSFTATAAYSASPQPALGTASMIGDFAPLAATMVASTEVAPRFLPGSYTVNPFSISACSSGGSGSVFLSQSALSFAANTGGTVLTPGQSVAVTGTSGVTSWSASSDSAWLNVAPSAGQSGGSFTASVLPSAIPAAGVYTGKIWISAPGATNSPVFLTCTLTVTSSGSTGPKIIKVSGDGQATSLYNTFTVPLVVKLVDNAGLPMAGRTVTWSSPSDVNFNTPMTTTTDSNGRAQVTAFPAGFIFSGTPFRADSVTATTDIGSATFFMTAYPTGVGYFPQPFVALVKPAQENRTITAKLGTPLVDAIRTQIVSGGGNGTNPTVIPNVSLNVSTSNTDPAAGIVARCQDGTPLSGADGIASCNLIVEGQVGTTQLLVNVGYLRDFPGVQLTVTPGDPVAPILLQGNGQTGQPGATLPTSLMVRIADAYGNVLPATPVSWSVLPAGNATLLNTSTQSDANGHASTQVQLGTTPGTVLVKVVAGGRESTFTLTVAGGTSGVTISLNRSSLVFASNSTGTAITSAQDLFLTVAGGTNNWTAVSNSPWLSVIPASGAGSGKFSVLINSSSLPAPGVYTGRVTVNATGATNGPLVLNCTLTVKGGTSSPYGLLETYGGGSVISGSVAVTGWALDDIGVKAVTIWRDPIGSEATHPNGLVYIGDALFVSGARPDVEARYSTDPRAYRAGWGYMLLTNTLPNGNGTFRLHAYAVDEEGNQTKLGTGTIVVDNLHAVKPFGALDAPAPGETISGGYANVGWALTPMPASIPLNGSTIFVNVDGVDIGHPSFGGFRSDIASIFPGYANSSSSAGTYYLDSTRYSNAMHAISWNVSDSQGHADGIGSRYFNIQNNVSGAIAADQPAETATIEAERTLQLRTARLRRAPVAANYPAFRRGYGRDATLTPIRQAGEGLLEPIELKQLDRLEVHLGGGQQWTATQRVGDETRDLPIGSTFDAEGGIFYWQLGPGFLGEFTLEFRAADGTTIPVLVRVAAR